MASQAKTILMMVFLVAIAAAVGYMLDRTYVLPAIAFSSIAALGSYFFSDKIVLSISGAKQLKAEDDPKLFELIGEMTPIMPKVYFINDSSPNAFAAGRDPKHAAICITAGLREKLNRAEMKGVIGHELSHVKNYDTLLMAVTAVLVGFVSLLADWFMRSLWFRDEDNHKEIPFILLGLILAILSPIIATIIQLAISRRREFEADASGAKLTEDPDALASALEKIAADRTVPKFANNATAHLFISNPFKGKSAVSFLANLFNTHPPIEERIKLLRAM